MCNYIAAADAATVAASGAALTQTLWLLHQTCSSEHNAVVLLAANEAWSIDGRGGGEGVLEELLALHPLSLLLHDLLHSEELLTSLLVHLLVDVLDDHLDARDENVLERVHTSTGHLDLHVEGHERSRKGGKTHQVRHGLQVHLLAGADDAAPP